MTECWIPDCWKERVCVWERERERESRVGRGSTTHLVTPVWSVCFKAGFDWAKIAPREIHRRRSKLFICTLACFRHDRDFIADITAERVVIFGIYGQTCVMILVFTRRCARWFWLFAIWSIAETDESVWFEQRISSIFYDQSNRYYAWKYSLLYSSNLTENFSEWIWT